MPQRTKELDLVSPLEKDKFEAFFMDSLKETDIRKRMKNQAKTDKTEHRMEEREKVKSPKSKVKVKVNPNKVKVKAEADIEEILNGPTRTHLMGWLKNMMASFFQMNTAFTSGTGSLPSNTIANPKGELKAITTRSGLVLDGPSVSMPPPFINPKEDERVEETLTDSELAEYTIKVPPPLVQKGKPTSLKKYVVYQRDHHHSHIPYPSRMNQEKQKEKDEVQIHKF
ncbi:hypothetical protein Tco_0326754 [Tanacetum coccineum]